MTIYNENKEDEENNVNYYVDDAFLGNSKNNSILISSPSPNQNIDNDLKDSILNNSSNGNFQTVPLDEKDNNNNNNNSNSETTNFLKNIFIINKIINFLNSKPASLYNTIHIAIGFLFIFMGFSPTQSLITQLHQDNGSISLALLYFSFAIGCFIAPLILKKIGLIKSLAIAAITYAIFIFCTITNVVIFEVLFLPSSILIGLGAGLLWNAQPVYVSRNSPTEKELGLYSGIFQTIYSMGGIIGNGFSGLLRNEGIEPNYILIILGFCTVTGSMILIFLRRVDPVVPVQRKSLSKTFMSVFMVFKDKKFLMLTPLFIVQGQSQAYFYETINGLIGIERIGYISVVMGIITVIGGSVWGRVHDKFKNGKQLLATILAILYIISLSLSSIAYWFDEIPLFYIIAAINGMFDSLQTILIFVTVASLYHPNDQVSAFSASRFLMSISTGSAFFVFDYLPFFVVIFWLLFLIVITQIFYHTLMINLKNIVRLPSSEDDDFEVNKFNTNSNTHHNHDHDQGYHIENDSDTSSYSLDDRI